MRKTEEDPIADAINWLTQPVDVYERHLVNALYAIAGDALSGLPSIPHSLDRIADAIFDLADAVRGAAPTHEATAAETRKSGG